MTQPHPLDFTPSANGGAEQTPEGSTPSVRVGSTPPAQSTVEYAVHALGELLNLAFQDALRIDHLARLTVTAWRNIDAPERITLGEQHPRLVEGLLLLENALDRIDGR